MIRSLERSRRDIVGTLKSTGRFLYVMPLDPVYRQDFYVPDAAGADINDRVVGRFTGWQNRIRPQTAAPENGRQAVNERCARAVAVFRGEICALGPSF